MAAIPKRRVNQSNNKSFPTRHPTVANKDGSRSNVRIATFGFGKKFVAIPTMVGGRQLSDDAAVKKARRMGLSKYPSFKSQKLADQWAKKNHDKIDASGQVVRKGKGISPPKRGSQRLRDKDFAKARAKTQRR